MGAFSFLILALNLKLHSRFILFGTIVPFVVLRYLGFFIIIKIFSNRKPTANTLILGTGSLASQIAKEIQASLAPNRIVGFVQPTLEEPIRIPKDKILITEPEIAIVIEKFYPIEEIVIASTTITSNMLRDICSTANYHGIRIRYVPDYLSTTGQTFKIDYIGQIPNVLLHSVPLDEMFFAACKRGFDLLAAIFGLVIALPFFILISLAIKLESTGPVFYRPTRIGKGGKLFQCLKFRSMYTQKSTKDNNQSTILDDPRVTKVGKVIRRLNLDELPQLINVIINDMSIVGPRPHREQLNIEFQRTVERYMLRHFIKPGITGWAQVNGWRGPTVTFEQKNNRAKHDIWYVENWSLLLDLKIIFLTIFGKKVRKNAF
jgi:putative colanic acid biosynthesis UDP-glucose lipid carrier transferase